jgi:hypothetical protein
VTVVSLHTALPAFVLLFMAPVCCTPQQQRSVPANTVLVKQLNVDFGGNAGLETVLAYGSESAPRIRTGVRVLKNGAIVYEESQEMMNGGGAFDAISIDKLKAHNGKEGVLVVLKASGAGTATWWHVLATVAGKISTLSATEERANILRQKGYQDWGYNGVTASGEYIVETQPGYSHQAARCCPDRPTVQMTFRFTGDSLLLEKVAGLDSKE